MVTSTWQKKLCETRGPDVTGVKMYLFGLSYNLRVEAGFEDLFALQLILAHYGSVVRDGCLEVVVRERRVAVLERVLEFKADTLCVC